MAVNKFINSQYPGFVTDAYNQYQPQFLQSLLNKQPLIPTTSGEQNVIQQGRDFTSNPMSNPMFGAYSNALTSLLQPSEETARRNLEDTFRRAGAGTLQSGAFATGAADLERDLYTNRGDIITKGYSQLYPAIGNQLNNQAGLESLPRLQQEKTLAQFQNLLSARPETTGVFNEPTTGEQIAEGLSGPLAAILRGGEGTLAGDIGGSISKALGLPLSAVKSLFPSLFSGQDNSPLTSQETNALNYSDEAFSDDFSGLDFLGGNQGYSTPLDFSMEEGLWGDMAGGGGLGNFANFDTSAYDFGDFSNFSNAPSDLGSAGADFGNALDNFELMDLPYSGSGVEGALSDTMSGIEGAGGSLAGIGGGLASAGIGALAKYLGAPPMASAGLGIVGGAASSALAGSTAFPFAAPLALLAWGLMAKPGETAESAAESSQMISQAKQRMLTAMQSGQAVNIDDLVTAGIVPEGTHDQTYSDWGSQQILNNMANNQPVGMSGENYTLDNVPSFIIKQDDYGIPQSDVFNIPQVALTPQQFQSSAADRYNSIFGRYKDPETGMWDQRDREWNPDMLAKLIEYIRNPPTGDRE